MGRGRDEIRVGNRIRVQPRRDESCNMCDVHHQIGADGFGDRLESWKIKRPGIGAGTDDDHSRTTLFGLSLDSVIVDDFLVAIDTVAKGLEQDAGKIYFAAVS